jgi:cytochrome c oxidase cbb3-type subunit 3
MKSFRKKPNKMPSRLARLFLIAAALMPLGAFAAESTAAKDSSGLNPVLLGLAAIVVVLMAAIALLANVLKQLAFAYRDQFRKSRGAGPLAKSVLLLLAFGFGAVRAFAQDAPSPEAAESAKAAVSDTISGISRGDFNLITGVIFFELVLVLALLSMIYQMVRLLRNSPEKRPLVDRILAIDLLDYFNKSVAVEKEHTIVIDHDYDGIHELDNSLPPWWKWGFVMTIVFAFGYMYYYHMADGPSQFDEYAAAVAKGEQEKQAFLAKAGNSIDETNVSLIEDAGKLADARTLFNNTCAACHREDGGGAVGPNLTDAYWLHGGSLQDVFKSVKYGWKDKGMPEWQHNLSPTQIAGIASYIMSLKGQNPPGAKAPQGDLYVDKNAKNAADSTGANPDRKLSQVAGQQAEAQKG